jgi:hypothetical protein
VQLRKLLKRKGIYVGLVALAEFCRSESAKAAPAHLVLELGRMSTAGPIDLAAVPAPGPAAPRPRFFQLRAAVADSGLHIVATCIGVIGLIIWLSIATVGWSIHNGGPHAGTAAPSVDKK